MRLVFGRENALLFSVLANKAFTKRHREGAKPAKARRIIDNWFRRFAAPNTF
jgi:hypothetical protein